MTQFEGIIQQGEENTLSFGNYTLEEKTKIENFQFQGDSYKVKTYKKITKLEKNGYFLFESVPGATVYDMKQTENEITFKVQSNNDIDITLGLMEGTEYQTFVNDVECGREKTNIGGKLTINVELNEGDVAAVCVKRV